ncbi:MAG: sodium:alanine symporter family protein [Peptostreptococcaceae bacterium]|nr:sodium:alanine symporter family protein [Peptostreptococcaceae bacterium]
METLNSIVNAVDGFMWGPPMIILLFGTHLFMTVRTGFVQRHIFTAIKISVTKDPDAEGDVTQFGALTTALASTIGTGNIVGVGTAIALGGPGAVLWLWLTGVFGMATKYAECLIGVKYRVKSQDGTMIGGAMYALERGLNMKWLGVIFALLTGLAAFGIGNTVQANAVSTIINENTGVPVWIIGLILAILVGVTIIGGIKSITKVSEKLVPFMAAFYFLGCVIILILNRDVLGETIVLICKSAFNSQAAGGGFIGASVLMVARFGIARGLFSNEAGLGSAPLVASAAQTRNSVRQALVSMTGSFWDTVIVCLITGLTLVSCVIKYPGIDATSGNGGILTSQAFAMIPVIGPIILTIGMATFAFSTILGWYYYGERCIMYLGGEKIRRPYQFAWTILVFVGSVSSMALVWNIADALNGMMAIPNLVAVLLLSGVIAKEGKEYLNPEHIMDKDMTPIPVLENTKKGVLF